ncbi:MAG: helix-turn-helix domain-containing protein [Thermodesulfobacteriota bacterium]
MTLSYRDIIERMKLSGKLKNDSAVARALDVTPQALSNYKKRGKMPTNLIIKFADINSLSVDWLLTGRGKPGEGAEGGAFSFAGEDTAPFGKEELSRVMDLSPEELIYVGKLLKVLRCPSNSTVVALKCSVDAFLKASELSAGEEGDGENKGSA